MGKQRKRKGDRRLVVYKMAAGSLISDPARDGERTVNNDRALREHVINLLKGGSAHVDFEAAVAGLPADLRGAKPPGVPHSPWRLLEHMRIAQWDILEFSRNPKHTSPHFPEGYWPSTPAPHDDAAWNKSVRSFRRDQRAMMRLISN